METASLNNYRFICFTDAGKTLMVKICKELLSCAGNKFLDTTEVSDLKRWTKDNFEKGNVLVFIGAMGIAVRSIAPFIKDKTKDPAVIVIDEKGEFVIPVLSAHIGGAAYEAGKISKITGGTAVITTATDVEGLFSVDVFATKHNMYISDIKKAKAFSRNILKKKTAHYYLDNSFGDYFDIQDIPKKLIRVKSIDDEPDLIISPLKISTDYLQLIPRCIVIGIGCKKGTKREVLSEFVNSCLEREGISVHAVRAVTSVDIKAHEEAIMELAWRLSAEFVTFTSEKLMEQKGDFSSSEFVKKVTGADNICERAVAAFGAKKIIVKKVSQNGMTFAAGVL